MDGHGDRPCAAFRDRHQRAIGAVLHRLMEGVRQNPRASGNLPERVISPAQLIRPTGRRQRLDQDRIAARTVDNPRIASNLAFTYKCQKPIIAALSSVIGFPEIANNTAATVDH